MLAITFLENNHKYFACPSYPAEPASASVRLCTSDHPISGRYRIEDSWHWNSDAAQLAFDLMLGTKFQGSKHNRSAVEGLATLHVVFGNELPYLHCSEDNDFMGKSE